MFCTKKSIILSLLVTVIAYSAQSSSNNDAHRKALLERIENAQKSLLFELENTETLYIQQKYMVKRSMPDNDYKIFKKNTRIIIHDIISSTEFIRAFNKTLAYQMHAICIEAIPLENIYPQADPILTKKIQTIIDLHLHNWTPEQKAFFGNFYVCFVNKKGCKTLYTVLNQLKQTALFTILTID